MEIAQFLPEYPFPNDDLFEEKVRAKKEFQRLESRETLNTKFRPQPHQIYAQRFLSGHTPYEASILFQKMGTGKTGLSILTVENNLHIFRGGVIIVPSNKFIRNFIAEILKVTGQKYYPARWQEMTPEERERGIRKQIKKTYFFLTYEAFANRLGREEGKIGDPQLKSEFSNMVIIADEAQNLREQKNKVNSSKIYEAFFTLFHTVENCKILLLTGTPMKDQWYELAALANLILPLDKQLPVGEAFEKIFFNDGKTIANEQNLKERLRGYISVLQSQPSSVKKRFVGSPFLELSVFAVDLCVMSDFQAAIYQKAYADDIRSDGKSKGIYTESQQAINFVFPDGTYGRQGFERNMVKPKKDLQLKARSYAVPVFTKELRAQLTGKDRQDTLNKIWQCSAKYASAIRDCLLQYQNKDGCTYIYNSLVDGSGALVFAQCLELFGYTRSIYGKENEKGLRYVLLTNSTLDDAGTIVTNVQETFADPCNAQGEYIHVIIGSRTSGEGLSFGNIQNVGILTPFWNYSIIDQAIYRGFRRNSHVALEKIYQQKGKELVVDIHHYMGLPPKYNQEVSLDYQMYRDSQTKDLKIKRGERLMKEIAYDCMDKYHLNSQGQPFTRECDYTVCEYKCEHQGKALPEDDLTYNLHYSEYDSALAQFKLIELFRTNFRFSFNEIRRALKDVSEFILYKTLQRMINNHIQIYNKYGVISYLKEQNNIYFLVSSPETNSRISLGFYAEYPTAVREMSLSEFNSELISQQSDVHLNNIVEAAKKGDYPTIENLMDRLSDEVKVSLLTELIEKEIVNPGKSIIRAQILNRYKGYIHVVGDTIALDVDEDEPICRIQGRWQNCEAGYVQYLLEQEKKQQTAILEQNPVGFYALINNELFRKDAQGWKTGFWIVDLRRKAAEFNPADKRTEIKGEKCGTGTLKIGKLAAIAYRTRWQPPITTVMSREQILNELSFDRGMSDVISQEELLQMSHNDLKRLFTFFKMKAVDLCNGLANWFEQNGLVRYTNKTSMK